MLKMIRKYLELYAEKNCLISKPVLWSFMQYNLFLVHGAFDVQSVWESDI